MKLHPLGIQISDYKMTPWIMRITAKNTLQEILGMFANTIRRDRSTWRATLRHKTGRHRLPYHRKQRKGKSLDPSEVPSKC